MKRNAVLSDAMLFTFNTSLSFALFVKYLVNFFLTQLMSGKQILFFQQNMYRLKLIQRDWYLGCSAPFPINTTHLVPTTDVVMTTTAHK